MLGDGASNGFHRSPASSQLACTGAVGSTVLGTTSHGCNSTCSAPMRTAAHQRRSSDRPPDQCQPRQVGVATDTACVAAASGMFPDTHDRVPASIAAGD